MNGVYANCPYCGRQIRLERAAATVGREVLLTEFQQAVYSPLTAPPVPPGGGDWRRVTPVGRLEPKDVLTAGLDAGVSFGLVTIAGVGVCWVLNWPWALAPASGMAAAIIRYYGGVKLAASLLEIVESVTATDLNHDGKVGAAPSPVPMEVIHKNEAGSVLKMLRFDLPAGVTEAQFRQWAEAVLANGDLTQARWVSRSKFTREDYTGLIAAMEQAGLVRRSGERANAPYELTRAGRNALRFLTHSHSLT